jgi:tetratricopeptide (TPR) repeat protein
MTKRHTSAAGALDGLGDAFGRLRLLLVRVRGSVQRRISRGPGRIASTLAGVSLVLLVGPAVLNSLLGLVPDSMWQTLQAGDGSVGRVWSVTNALAVWAGLTALLWVVRARKRIVVEEFAVAGGEEARLAGRLLDELSRIRSLYDRVNHEDSSPLSVGVKAMEDLKPGVELGQFLSVTADDLGATLNDVVATKATVPIVGLQLPIGLLASIFGRLARGPRLRGTLDHTSSGGPTLTVELVGGPNPRRWSVDGAGPADADAMLAELACRVFNDLSLGGSVSWRASRAFNEYLELLSQGRSCDRVTNLKRAEGKLLEAVAEDQRFDLAFYNLGIVYSLLADTERAAAERSEYTKPSDRPLEAYYGRLDAARAAFERASGIDRERTDPVYALAVHRFTRTEDLDVDGLVEIVKHCKRVIELKPDHAQAHDLKGMALLALGQAADSEASHEIAAKLATRRLRRAVLAKHAGPPTADDPVPGARANLAAALRNLADVNRVRAGWDDRRDERLQRADRLFARASELATGDTKAATLWAHGQLLEHLGHTGRARDVYAAALRIDPKNPSYSARLAGAFAAGSEWQPAVARSIAVEALDGLAPVYRRTLRPHHASTTVMMRDSTLNALERTYERLGDTAGVDRVKGIRTLWPELRSATDRRDVAALRTLTRRFGDGREWELEQVQLALAIALGRHGRWSEAEVEYRELIAFLEQHRPAGIVQHNVHAGHARALRKLDRLEDALEAAATGQFQNPLSASARRELGKAHFALSQFEEALGAWEHALWLAPNDPHLHWKVAFCRWNIARDDHDEAARRASLVAAADGFEQAALLFDVRDLEGWAWSRLWAGRSRHELGEHDHALRHLRAAAGCRPTATAAALLLGEVDREIGDRHLGRARLEDAVNAMAGRDDLVLDAGWGDTLTGEEAAVRAAVGLGLMEDDDKDAGARAAAARSVMATISDPVVRARCEAAIAALETPPPAMLKRAA